MELKAGCTEEMSVLRGSDSLWDQCHGFYMKCSFNSCSYMKSHSVVSFSIIRREHFSGSGNRAQSSFWRHILSSASITSCLQLLSDAFKVTFSFSTYLSRRPKFLSRLGIIFIQA